MTRFKFVIDNIRPECELLLEEEKDDSQEYAKLKEGIAFEGDSVHISEYASEDVLSFLRSTLPGPWEWGCSCHIAPPCGYCVQYAHIECAIKELENP